MDLFLNAARKSADYTKLVKYLCADNNLPALVTGVSHIHKAHFISALVREKIKLPVLVIAESEGEAQKLCLDINMMSGENTALLYPAKELMLGSVEAASREYEHKRIFALSAMSDGTCGAVICSAEAAAQLTIPPEELAARTINISEGDEISQEELVARLNAAGYSRADLIEGAGQYSVRGGIIDVFPPSSVKPFRIELWGDSVDSISEFDTDTQRRTEERENICISPACETLFDSAGELCARIEKMAAKLRGKRAEELKRNFLDDVSKIRSGVTLHSTDKYFPLCYDKEATVFDYAGSVFVCENVTVRESFRSAALQHTEDLKILFDEGKVCKGNERFMLTKSELYGALDSRTAVYFDAFMRGGGLELGTMINVQSAVQTSPWSGEYKLLEEELGSFLGRGYSCVVFAGTDKGAHTLASDLIDVGCGAGYCAATSAPV